MPRAEVRRYDVGHFDIYQGQARESSISDQLAFLQRHLPCGPRRQAASSGAASEQPA